MRKYNEVFGHVLPALPREPVLSISTHQATSSMTESWPLSL